MRARQSVFGDLLDGVARAVRNMSDAEFEKLVKGELRPFISFQECGGGSRRRKPSPAMPEPMSEDELRSIRTKLDAARTREEGHRIVQEALPLKERLFAFARFLDLPIGGRDRTERIRDKIVASTVGRRLASEAIRGGYSAD